MNKLPDDLRIAYETFTLLATKHGFSFAGMMVNAQNPTLVAIGNVSERGYDLATLFREYANILDEKTTKGQVAQPALDANVN